MKFLGDYCLPAGSGTNAMLDYWRLMRPRIVALVLLAMGVSAWTTAAAPPAWRDVAQALLGAALVIGGAIALNQRLECRGDARMPRTAGRPLPAGRLSRRQVTTFGLVTTAVGLTYLLLATNPTLVLLAAMGWLVYVGVYTPLKTRSTWQTPIGAAAGAMPVLLGAAAVGGSLSAWAFVLFGIVYFWQFPHAMAIAWHYRQEFAAAEVKVAAVTDPTGRSAALWAVLGAAILLPVSLAPVLLGLAGPGYGVAALGLGTGYFVASVCFARRRDDASARQLLLASLAYLPAMLTALALAS
jgi:heme o synthase